VETKAQRDWLATNGCHAYQGYLYGRPEPLESLSLERPKSVH
jgi:EAL domain-containing protein (putative c-di-GMP-specific phosphodiesterase class I)